MRPDRGHAALGIGAARRLEPPAQRLLGGQRRHRAEPGLDLAGKREARLGERTLRRSGAGGIEPRREIAARGGDRHAVARHALLEGGEPAGIARPLTQQARALAHRLLIGGEAGGVAGIEAQDQPVEKAPARASALDEEPVHLRREPNQMDQARELRLALGLGAVDADEAALAGGARRVAAGADLHLAARGLEPGGDRPGPGRHLGRAGRRHAAVDLAKLGAAQAAAGREKGNCFQEIGLARAVGARQHHGAVVELDPGAAVAAKIGEDETRHGRPRRRDFSLSYIGMTLIRRQHGSAVLQHRCACHTRIGMRT